jgi:hypothetical protein
MSQIEPNLLALCCFAVFWGVCCLSFFQLAGMYSIRDRRGDAPSVSTALILGNTALWLALLAGTGMFAYVELRWTTIVVVSGILFLFVPELFQALPTRWRDGDLGLFGFSCVIVSALAILAFVGATSIKSLLS